MEVQTSGKSIDSVLERVLCMNILSSDYFKELYRLKTYHEVIDEIYNQVDHVEPWMTGNCRGPSTAFCLLYKLFTMKLTVKQMQGLLNHGDSPYIRAVGFLYLRYVGDPKSLWSWFDQYVTDKEEFSPGSNRKMTTIGVYVRDLLLDQYYFDTLFPRIPVPVMRQLKANLERMKLSTQPSGTTGTGGRHTSDDTARRPPSVKAALSVSFGQRAPHRASTRDSSPIRRSVPVISEPHIGEDDHTRPSKGADRRRDYDAAKESTRDKDRERERERDRRRSASRERHRERDRDSERDRDRSRDYEVSRDRDRNLAREKLGQRETGRDRDHHDTEKEGSRDRHYGDHGRKRERSPSPRRSDDRYQTKSSRPESTSNLDKLRDMYGDASAKSKTDQKLPHSKDESGADVIRLGASRWT